MASNSVVILLYPSAERSWLAASCCNAAIELSEAKESKLSDLCMSIALKFVEVTKSFPPQLVYAYVCIFGKLVTSLSAVAHTERRD